METTLWAVGQIISQFDKNSWEFIGIFDTELAAIEACTSPRHFIGPVTLNEICDGPAEDWPDAYFPLQSKEASDE